MYMCLMKNNIKASKTDVTSRVPLSLVSSPQLQQLEIGMKAMGISIPPYSTYVPSFNFISFVLPEISFDEKSVTYNLPPAQLAEFDTALRKTT